MNENKKILICYNEPTTIYNNYIGKEINSENENIDLSESEFAESLESIRDTLLSKFENVKLHGVNHNIKETIKELEKGKDMSKVKEKDIAKLDKEAEEKISEMSDADIDKYLADFKRAD